MSVSIVLMFFLFVSYVMKNISVTVGAECCSLDSILFKMRALNQSNVNGCFHLTNDINGDLLKVLNTVNKIESPFGFGLNSSKQLNLDMKLPHCAQTSFINISRFSQTSLNLSINSCLLLLDNNLFAVTCNSTNNDILQSIGFMNKCCPRGFTYKSEVNKCFESEPNFNMYSTIFDKPMIFMDSFKCPNNKVIVEYVVSADSIYLKESHLIWRDKNRVFSKNNFCLEAISVIKKNGYTRMINQTQKFLIRSCEQPQICKSLPCLRKCCGDGEIFYKNNVTTFCKKEEKNLKFQSFMSLNVSGNFTEFSGIHFGF